MYDSKEWHVMWSHAAGALHSDTVRSSLDTLYTMADIQEMIEMATSAQVSADQKLRELLDIMIEESDPNLQVSYTELDEVLQSSSYFLFF